MFYYANLKANVVKDIYNQIILAHKPLNHSVIY